MNDPELEAVEVEILSEMAADEFFSHKDSIISDLRELATARAENDTLRGLLGNSAKDCPYCGLPAADQAKCAMGFPGCARADDQMLFKHFADAYRADIAEKKLAAARERIADLQRRLSYQQPKIESVTSLPYAALDAGKKEET